MDYLYHYTSIETLALILSNKTLCFNNLLNVDDIEEAETSDMGKFGRFVYASCWTNDERESIPLWNLYTPDMHGVRIKLPVFPFKRYSYKKGEYFLENDVETYINIEKLYKENKVSIVANQPQLVEIEYTVDPEKLYPKVRTLSSESQFQHYLSSEESNNVNFNVLYSFKDVGKYKRKEWSFQKEWRYIYSVSPMGEKELNPPTLEKHRELIRRIEDREYKPPYTRMFLELDDNSLKNIEVLCGPRMNDAEKVVVKALLEKYCPSGIYKESTLKINRK